MIDIDNMTPSEVALHREIDILKGKLRVYESPHQPTYLVEDPPSIMAVHDTTTTMQLGIKARVESDDNHGYHVYAKDVHNNYKVSYYVSDMALMNNRYRVRRFMNEMMRDVTHQLASDILKGKA